MDAHCAPFNRSPGSVSACQLNSRSDLSIRRVWNAHDGGALLLLAELTWESGKSPRRETRRLVIHPSSTLYCSGMACAPGRTVLIRPKHERAVRGRAHVHVEIRPAPAGRHTGGPAGLAAG